MSDLNKAPSEIILAFSNLNSHLDDAPSVHGGNRFQCNIRRVDNYSCIHVLWDHGMIAYALYMANEGGVTILLIPEFSWMSQSLGTGPCHPMIKSLHVGINIYIFIIWLCALHCKYV